METDARKVQGQSPVSLIRLGLPNSVSPLRLMAPGGNTTQTRGSLAESMASPLRLVIPSGQALGTREDREAHPELPAENPHFQSGGQPRLGPKDWLGGGESSGQAAPAAVCFLPSGLLPKANKPGRENEGGSEDREMPSQVAQPQKLPGSPGMGSSCSSLFLAGDPVRAKSQTGR